VKNTQSRTSATVPLVLLVGGLQRMIDCDAKKPHEWDDEGFRVAAKIATPEYDDVNTVYKYADIDIGSIGFDLGQVKGGTFFDNDIVTDDVADAVTFAKNPKELSDAHTTNIRKFAADGVSYAEPNTVLVGEHTDRTWKPPPHDHAVTAAFPHSQLHLTLVGYSQTLKGMRVSWVLPVATVTVSPEEHVRHIVAPLRDHCISTLKVLRGEHADRLWQPSPQDHVVTAAFQPLQPHWAGEHADRLWQPLPQDHAGTACACARARPLSGPSTTHTIHFLSQKSVCSGLCFCILRLMCRTPDHTPDVVPRRVRCGLLQLGAMRTSVSTRWHRVDVAPPHGGWCLVVEIRRLGDVDPDVDPVGHVLPVQPSSSTRSWSWSTPMPRMNDVD
jgi:hypothetical protein